MLEDYLPILLLAGVVTVFGALSLAVAALLRPFRPTPAKSAPYESGITPVRLPASERFPVKFYVVAMLFIIFDIETIFFYPWAVAFRQLGLFGLVEMLVFIGLLFVAYIYVWQKGGLDWAGASRPSPRAAGRLPASVELGPGEGPMVAPELTEPMRRAQPVELQEPTTVEPEWVG